MKIVITLFALAMAFYAFSAFAQEELTEVALAEYLDMVKTNHPYFNKEQLSVDIEEKQAQSLLGAKDWYLSVVTSRSFAIHSTIFLCCSWNL